MVVIHANYPVGHYGQHHQTSAIKPFHHRIRLWVIGRVISQILSHVHGGFVEVGHQL